METLTEIIEQQITAGYCLSPPELKKTSCISKDQYIGIVSVQVLGLKLADMDFLSLAQEKAYKAMRNTFFSRELATYKTPDMFYKLTDLDQKIYVKCIGRFGHKLPSFLIENQPTRYWYNLWYAEANKLSIRKRTSKYLNSFPVEVKIAKKKKNMESKKKYLTTVKGRLRRREYFRHYHRKRSLMEGKTAKERNPEPRTPYSGLNALTAKIKNLFQYMTNKKFL